jgi:large subunit ribosomal protein L3
MLKLLGKKMGMTSFFEEDGTIVPVTIVELEPNTVTQIKTVERDGYSAVQVGMKDGMKDKNLSKSVKGHLKKTNSDPMRTMIEFRAEDTSAFEEGSVIGLDNLNEAMQVDVIGTTKGRGFTGGMKRHGFKGHRASHGEEKHHRTNGSISSTARLTHVWKGKRMSGHMGDVQQTVKNLDIVEINKEKNILVIKGSIPGHSGSTVMVVQ